MGERLRKQPLAHSFCFSHNNICAMKNQNNIDLTPHHDFSPKLIKAERKRIALPRLQKPLSAHKVKPFNLDTSLQIYTWSAPKIEWPEGLSRWNYTIWEKHIDTDTLSKEEARFWVHATLWSLRCKESQHTLKSPQELRKIDYTQAYTVEEWIALLEGHDPKTGERIDYKYRIQYDSINLLAHAFRLLLTPSERIQILPYLFNPSYTQDTYLEDPRILLPTARSKEELLELQPFARKALEGLAGGYEKNDYLVEELVVTYNLTDQFKPTLDCAVSNNARMTDLLNIMIYHLDDHDLQRTYLEQLNISYDASFFMRDIAVNGLKHIDLWINHALQFNHVRQYADKYLWFSLLKQIHHPDVVLAMLTFAADSRYQIEAEHYLMSARTCTTTWLVSFLSTQPTFKDLTIRLLRQLKQGGHEDLIVAAQDTLDEQGKAELEEHVLNWKHQQAPILQTKDAPPCFNTLNNYTYTQPAWLEHIVFPPQFIKNRSLQLSDKHVLKLIAVLQAQKDSDTSSDLLIKLKQHLDPDALGELGWTIFESWARSDTYTQPSTQWVERVLGHIGTDLQLQKAATYLKSWTGHRPHKVLIHLLHMYKIAGTNTALMILKNLSKKLPKKALRVYAHNMLQQIAQTRNLTDAELEDRMIPSCGLDHMGHYTFDYGARTFSLAFADDLRPVLHDNARQKMIKNLPKPNKKDDLQLATQARETFKFMKNLLKTTFAHQIPRLERCMVTEHSWTAKDFQEFLLNHPLMCHIAHRLLWGVRTKNNAISTCFRADEDNNLVDAEDEPFTLPDDAYVSIVHPLDLTEELRTTWGTIFADYEIIPPFPQLNRHIYTLGDDERERDVFTRWGDLKAPGTTLRKFAKRDTIPWTCSSSDPDYCWYNSQTHQIKCVISTDYGDVRGHRWARIYFVANNADNQEDITQLTLKDVPPALLNEVIASLHRYVIAYATEV